MRIGFALFAALALAACVRVVPDSATPPAASAIPTTTTAAALTLARGASIASLGVTNADAAGALASFRESCPKLLTRTDQSGLTLKSEWQPACSDADSWPASDAASFFARHFDPVRVGDGTAFATGYFEPEIAGSRSRAPGYEVPVYSMPPELVRAWGNDVPEQERTGRAPLGRYAADGSFVPFYERAEIEAGALANRGLEIAWAADPIEMFFLQIQGSGLLRLPDGSQMRIGYAGQNGREYLAIGAVMRERGLLGEGPGKYAGSMQGIVQYLRDNPEDGADLMRLNKSWIFFRELDTDGPLGALGVPVRRENSVATDPNYVPLGAPVWLDLDRDVADGLWIAQDTGGAIKGANRFDTFWGNGGNAAEIAGSMSGRGQALVFLPKGSLARLRSQ